MKLVEAIKDYEIGRHPASEVHYQMLNPNQLVGPNVSLIPMHNAVQAARSFYGARFGNQAQAVLNNEPPLVQTRMEEFPDKSYDEHLGKYAGAVRADTDGVVDDVQPTHVTLRTADGTKKRVDLFRHMPFNRYSGLLQTPVVKAGQTIKANDLLAKSNFTDANGTLALGLNARVGVVPFKGFSMDDAIVVSQAFANRATSHHVNTLVHDFSNGDQKGGTDHFRSLFPQKFTRDQLAMLDEHGVIKPGTTVQPGDPLVLATRPRNFNSAQSASLGRLGRVARQLRADASTVWDSHVPGVVQNVVRKKDGTVKLIMESHQPMMMGDKVALRSGQKGIVSKIIPDNEMPRTADGKPLEVLLNQQGIPSRANPSLIWEILMGKVARAKGAPVKLPAFNRNDDSWADFVEKQLKDNNLTDKETVFDPKENRKLDRPITVGDAYVLKLHHVAAKKISSRGQGTYDCFDDQTEVFTMRGWVKWPEVTSKDRILDPHLLPDGTYGGDFVKPLKLQHYLYQGDMLRWDSKFLNWVVTPNHKFHVHLKRRTGPIKELTAEQMYNRKGKSLLPCAAKWTGGANGAFKILSGSRSCQKQNKAYVEDLKVNFADYAEFAAWYIAEGSCQISKGRQRVFIWQKEEVNPRECRQICDLLTRLGVAWYPVRRKGHVVGFAFQDSRWATLVQSWGAYAWTKHIPEDILMATPEVRSVFLTTYLKGDGSEQARIKSDGRSKVNHVSNVASTSPQVITGLEFMITSLGMSYGVNDYPAGVMTCPDNNKKYARRPYSVIGLHLVRKVASVVSSAYDARYEGRWQKVPYRGGVYCATMPSGRLLVRREGKICITGNSNQQPSRGPNGAAKRRSGLEVTEMISSGAYHNLDESATLTGQQNDDFWRAMRAGQSPKPPGSPFVWTKFRALLNGAGLHARDLGDGRLRLGLMTDKVLSQYNPLTVRNGKTINYKTQEPEEGGLFDTALVGGQRWGKIDLPEPMPNPAAEDSIRALLGLSKKDFEEILAGEKEMPHR